MRVLLDLFPDRLLAGCQVWRRLGTGRDRTIVLFCVEADQAVVGQVAEGGKVGAGLGIEPAHPDAAGGVAQDVQHAMLFFGAAQFHDVMQDSVGREREQYQRLFGDPLDQPLFLQGGDDG